MGSFVELFGLPVKVSVFSMAPFHLRLGLGKGHFVTCNLWPRTVCTPVPEHVGSVTLQKYVGKVVESVDNNNK